MSVALTSGQQTFRQTFAALTGLNADVVAAWMLSEESGSAAQARQAAGNHNWLNIGHTDSGSVAATKATYWRSPVQAAQVSAQWMMGKGPVTVDWGRASPGIQQIIPKARGKKPDEQIAAIAHSGWATSPSYESDIRGLYNQVRGSKGSLLGDIAGIAALPITGPIDAVGSLLGGAGDVAGAVGDIAKFIAKFVSALFDPSTYLRLGKGLLGAMFIQFGVLGLILVAGKTIARNPSVQSGIKLATSKGTAGGFKALA